MQRLGILPGLMSTKGRWPKHQIAFVRDHYGIRPVQWIADRVERNASSVHELAGRFHSGTGGAWSAYADKLLREALVHKVPRSEVARRLGFETLVVEARISAWRGDAKDTPLTPMQVNDFKRFYGGVPDDDLVAYFGLTRERLHEAAERFMLSKDKALMAKMRVKTAMPRWSDHDIEELRRMYADTSNLELARLLGKSVKSVVSKAHNLGIKKSPEYLRAMGRENVVGRYQ